MPGVKFNKITKKWEAKLGVKILGEFKTKIEAEDCYDETATKIFAFPFLNNKKVEEDGSEET